MGKKSNDLLMPVLKAAGIHVLMFALLFVSFHPTLKEMPTDLQAQPAPIIMATAISSETIKKLVNQKQQKKDSVVKAERDRKNRIKREADRKRKAVLDKKRKKAADVKKRKKLDDDKKRKKLDDDKKRKKTADDKKLKDDAEKKRKADAEKKRKTDAEKLRKQQLENERQAKITAELNAVRQRQVLSEQQKYIGLIKGKISRYWITPNQNEVCILKIRLGPGGIVLDVKVKSGIAAVCRSAMAAVYKSDPLPVSKESDVFKKFRNFELVLDPQDKQ
jgi:colicin import membrane protein